MTVTTIRQLYYNTSSVLAHTSGAFHLLADIVREKLRKSKPVVVSFFNFCHALCRYDHDDAKRQWENSML